MGDEGYESFKLGTHGELGCVYCHNGVDGTADKTEAHSGDFLRHPSAESREKCSVCHVYIVERTTNSLHEQGWGQKNMVVGRSGYGNHPTEFDNLPELMKSGYDTNCAKCHGSCGECHIIRPKAGGGGLLNGHNFNKTPHMRNNCTTCHVSRGGHAFFGEAIGTKPDVHLTKVGFDCMSCHTMNEIHGDGNIYETRYKMPMLPKCENCHSAIQNSNMYHSMHMDTFSCYTCHSQDFNNCGSCHVHGEGARIPSHQKFKIGMNPIPDIKPYKMATLRQSLSAPDTWKEYGISDLANFTYAPTYKYTTPHNILRWTQRTEVDSVIDSSHPQCAQACHIIKDASGNLVNEEYYLYESDLNDWEIEATKHICVDGKLPESWEVN
jgi:thiosulfate/3-mercaptopyruvate sulfurtransferase